MIERERGEERERERESNGQNPSLVSSFPRTLSLSLFDSTFRISLSDRV